jgi:RimJ/RimL family protein N-acetyltransferase
MDLDSMPEGGYRRDLVRLRPKTRDDVDPGYGLIQEHGALLDGRTGEGASALSRGELTDAWCPWQRETPLGIQYQLAIEELESGQFRGSFVIRCELAGQTAEVGYWVDPNHWGRGLGREALRLAQWWAFSHLGARSITARVQPDNARSIRLLEGLGFESLGMLPGRGAPLMAYHLPRFRWPDREGLWSPLGA